MPVITVVTDNLVVNIVATINDSKTARADNWVKTFLRKISTGIKSTKR